MKTCIAISSIINRNAPIALTGDITNQIHTAHVLGFDAIEIHTASAKLIDPQNILELTSELGLKVATLGTGPIFNKFGFSLTDPDKTRRENLRAMIKGYVDIAAILHSYVTLGSIKGCINENNTGESYNILVNELKTLTSYAKEKNVIFLLEATNRYENNYFNRGMEIKTFLEKESIPQIKILMDTFHMNIEEASCEQVLWNVKDFLGHVHFADNNRNYPGNGCFDFTPLISDLKAMNYQGYVSIECLPFPTGIEAAQKSINFLKQNLE